MPIHTIFVVHLGQIFRCKTVFIKHLHGLRTSIFNKFPSLLLQTIAATPSSSAQSELGLKHLESESRVEQLEQSIAEQTVEHIDKPEHHNTEQILE